LIRQTSMGRFGVGGAMGWQRAVPVCQAASPVQLALLVEAMDWRRTPIWAIQIMTALAAEDKDMAAERIGADDLLHLGCQTVKPGAQIDRLAGEKDLSARPPIPMHCGLLRLPARANWPPLPRSCRRQSSPSSCAP